MRLTSLKRLSDHKRSLACNFSLVCNFWLCSRQYLQFLSCCSIFLFPSLTLSDSFRLTQTHLDSLILIDTHKKYIEDNDFNDNDDEKPLLKALCSFAEGALKKTRQTKNVLNLLNLWSSSKKKVRILYSSLIGLRNKLTSAKNYSIPILFWFILVGFMIMVSIQVSLGLQKLIKCVPEPIGVCSTIWEFTECRKLFVTKRGTYCVNI